MDKIRFFNDYERHSVDIEFNMLRGNLNQMCVTDDYNELLYMRKIAINRIDKIFEICSNKFKDCSSESFT